MPWLLRMRRVRGIVLLVAYVCLERAVLERAVASGALSCLGTCFSQLATSNYVLGAPIFRNRGRRRRWLAYVRH